MPVAGVLAVAHIGHEQQLRDLALHGPHRLLHDAVVGISAGCQLVLDGRDSEQDHAADPELGRFRAFLHQFIDGELIIARHRTDFAPDTFARTSKQRQDELRGREAAFREPGCAAPQSHAAAAFDESEKPSGLAFLNLHRFQLIAFLNLVDHILTTLHLTEHGVLAVQPIRDYVRDEELAAVGVRARVGHG